MRRTRSRYPGGTVLRNLAIAPTLLRLSQPEGSKVASLVGQWRGDLVSFFVARSDVEFLTPGRVIDELVIDGRAVDVVKMGRVPPVLRFMCGDLRLDVRATTQDFLTYRTEESEALAQAILRRNPC